MAYTKYSLTPANNTAAPPDGAPEGMLPSAVNDTMRDMMAQIRDAGDGIRNGTYTMTAPVITGGSITGVALSGNTLTNPVITGGSINNTPIGASTANTGAFTTLGASGVATFSAGTVSAPAITTTGDTNTGIFFPAADTIAFTEGGVESMRIDSSGNVGIGTSSPTVRFTVGAYANAGTAGTAGIYGANIAALNTAGILTIGATDSLAADIGGSIGFTANAGTFSGYPTGSIAGRRENATSGNYASYMQFTTSTSVGTVAERMRIDSSGNVAIGATTAFAKLDVTGSTVIRGNLEVVFASGAQIALNTTNNGYLPIAINNGTAQIAMTANGAGTELRTITNHPQIFMTNNTERMRIDSSGNLLVGTTAEWFSRKTVVEGSEGVAGIVSAVGSFPISAINQATSGDNTFHGFWTESKASPSLRGTINYNRVAGLVAYNTTSDYRAKDIISSVFNSGEVIDSVPVYMGKMKGATQARPMFIAHETPDYAHTGEKDAVDKDGKPIYQQMDASSLVPVLWAEIQSLRKRVAQLEFK